MVDTNGVNSLLNCEGRGWEAELRDQRHGFWLLDSAARSVSSGGSVGTSDVIRIHMLLICVLLLFDESLLCLSRYQ